MDFTIVTPSFKQLDHLACNIASVADQEGVTWEHIIQDGGTPGVVDFAKQMENRWPDRLGCRRIIISEQDLGMYDAINKGLRRGSGDICAYLNCDEQLLPGALAKVKSLFQANPRMEILHGAFLVVNLLGKLITGQKPVAMFWQHVATSHLPNFSCSTFFRRTLLEKKRAYFRVDYQYCADALWAMERLKDNTPTQKTNDWISVFVESGSNAGIQEAGLAEAEKIKATLPRGVRFLSPWWKCRHRLSKLLLGSYAWGRVGYKIYLREKPTQRIYQQGWIWPMWWGRLSLVFSKKRGQQHFGGPTKGK
jgi:glycosyltransferase involved in cell wall biosynthesis